MPERFSFECTLFGGPALPPSVAMSAIAKAFAEEMGPPLEVMSLDVGSGRQHMVAWPEGAAILDSVPGATTQLFRYHASPAAGTGRIVLSYSLARSGCAAGISFPDMVLAGNPQRVVATLLALRHATQCLAQESVIGAGGEADACYDAETPKDAVRSMLGGIVHAHWIAAGGTAFPDAQSLTTCAPAWRFVVQSRTDAIAARA